uniref:Uncharacterized protein n=1 Tax=Panagrolaimus sp. JU765 TaxID=591449 RepID=A0AC34Q232_9BILA
MNLTVWSHHYFFSSVKSIDQNKNYINNRFVINLYHKIVTAKRLSKNRTRFFKMYKKSNNLQKSNKCLKINAEAHKVIGDYRIIVMKSETDNLRVTRFSVINAQKFQRSSAIMTR